MAKVLSSFAVNFVAALLSVLSGLNMFLPDKLIKCLGKMAKAPEEIPGVIPSMVLYGVPGSGKTSVAEAFALAAGARKFFYQCTPITGGDQLLGQPNMAAIIRKEAERVIADGVLIKATKAAINGEDVVIIIDELDKAIPETDAFLLDFLNSRRITDTNNELLVIPEDVRVWCFITTNEERDLSDALVSRSRMVTTERPGPELVGKILGVSPDCAMVGIYMANPKLSIRQLKNYLADDGDPDNIDWDVMSMYCREEDIDRDVLEGILYPEGKEEDQEEVKVWPMWLHFNLDEFTDVTKLRDFSWEYNSDESVRMAIPSLSEFMNIMSILKEGFKIDVRTYCSDSNVGTILDCISPILENKVGGIFRIGEVTFVAKRLSDGRFFLPVGAWEYQQSNYPGFLHEIVEKLLPKWKSGYLQREEEQKKEQRLKALREARQKASDGEAYHMLSRLGLDDLI